VKDNPLLSGLRCAAWIFVSCSVVQYSSLDLKCRGCSVVKCTFGFVKLTRNLTLSGRRIYVAWPGVMREREREMYGGWPGPPTCWLRRPRKRPTALAATLVGGRSLGTLTVASRRLSRSDCLLRVGADAGNFCSHRRLAGSRAHCNVTRD